ncbi:MAG: 6-phosphogluconolactonase [Verrucomicrobiota bacterium]
MKRWEILSFTNPEQLANAVATAWLGEVDSARGKGKPYCVALSGGRITQKLFTAFVGQVQARDVSVDHVHFFWADERCVPPSHSESNFRMAQELLFAPLGIPASQIHRLRGEDDPEVAARAAEAEIRSIAPLNDAGQPVVDLFLLGLGEDGHVASLFPLEPEAVSRSAAVYRAVYHSPKPPPRRITIGFPAIAAANQAWMLASGQGKENALRASLAPGDQTPFGRVLNLRSWTKIFSDVPC